MLYYIILERTRQVSYERRFWLAAAAPRACRAARYYYYYPYPYHYYYYYFFVLFFFL